MPKILRMAQSTLTARRLPALAGGAFDAPDGGVVSPMKTGFGWHLLHDVKVLPAH